MKTFWAIVITEWNRRWDFDSYEAVVKAMKDNFGVTDMPKPNQVTDKTRIGRQLGKIWVQVDAVPLYTDSIKLTPRT